MALHNILMSKQGFKTRIEVGKVISVDSLKSGEVLLEIDRFAITANVVRDATRIVRYILTCACE
jgi:hypothetical protein